MKKYLSWVLIALFIAWPAAQSGASTGCNYPASLDSWADKATNDYLTVADVNQFRCAIEKLESGPLRPDDGTAAAPAYAFRTSATAGTYLSAANEISWSTSSTQFLKLTSTGVLQAVGTGEIKADLILEGSDTTESTTTATAYTDLCSVGSLSIAATEPIIVSVVIRKTTGAANTSRVSLKLNTAQVAVATWSGSTNAAESGTAWFFVGAHDGTYSTPTFGVTNGSIGGVTHATFDTAAPNAIITDVVIRMLSDDAAITSACDEMHVYSLASS